MRSLARSVLGIMMLTSGVVGCGDSTAEDDTDGAGGSVTTSDTTSSNPDTTTTSAPSTSTSPETTDAGSTGSGVDPYEDARVLCIAKINELRATKGLPAYGRWTAAETCVDKQATNDETSMQPHQAWKTNLFPECNGSGQNECLGAGVAGIEGCLDSMWGEKDQAGCAGCDACADAYDPNCPNCDFFGQTTGDVCGHYVNMSAKYFSEAACGFSSLGGWDAINFH